MGITQSLHFRNNLYLFFFNFQFHFQFYFHLRLFIPSSNGFSCSNPFLHSPYRSCPCWAKESESTSTNGSGAYGCRNKCACCCRKTNQNIRVHPKQLRKVLPPLRIVLQRPNWERNDAAISPARM